MISIAAPIIEQEERDAVNEVLRSGILAQGPKVAELETAFAAYCGTKYAAAVNSGTAALHASLHVAGVGDGDEVITVPYTFIATVNAILMVGARPVFVDIDPDTYNIDVSQVEKAITPKTKAIIPVDLYGQPVNYDELQTLADKYGLVIVEDACQAIGADYKGKKAGSLGSLGCFSLYATKNIMSGEGGVVVTDNEAYLTALRQFRQHGMSAQYEYVDMGYNYRMSDLHAAIAVEQLRKVERFNAARQENAARLTAGLKSVPGIVLPITASDRTHVYHQYAIRVTDDFAVSRQELIDALRSADIGSGVYYPHGLHTTPHLKYLGYAADDFPVTERTAAEILALPIHPKVTATDIDHIIDVIQEVSRAK